MNRIDVNTMTMESHAHILAALAAYEAGQAGKPPPPTRFAVRNPWLVRAALLPGLLRGMLALSPAPVPGLQYKHIFGVLASLKPGDAPLRLASAADAIQIKKEDQTRIRAFYLPQEGRDGECLKLVSARHGIAARTRQELDLRRRLESLGTITLPKITAVAEDEDYIYIREEMVLGRRFDVRRDAALFLREGLPQLAATYRAMGLRQEPLAGIVDPAWVEKLRSLPDAAPLAGTLESICAENHMMAAGFCHGDLLPSNLCVAAGRFYFFDWEKSLDGPVSHDLFRLVFKYPGRTDQILAGMCGTLETVLGASPASVDAQLAVYTAARIVQRSARARAYHDIWQRHNAWRRALRSAGCRVSGAS